MKHNYIAIGRNTGMFGRILSQHFFFAQHDDITALLTGIDGKVDKLGTKADTAATTALSAKQIAEAAQKSAEAAAEVAKIVKENQEKSAEAAAANQKLLDSMAVDIKAMKEGGLKVSSDPGKSFYSEFSSLITKNIESIRDVGRGHKFVQKLSGGAELMRTKVAANMTTATDLTGSPVVTFMPQPVLLPAQKVNVRDLVTSFQSSTETINIFRENSPSPAQGGFAQQLTEGTLKSQIEYQYTNVAFTATYIAGFVRFAKQMLYNLPWLQTALPRQLIRDFYIKENAIFFQALASAATGPTATVDSVTGLGTQSYAARLIQVIAGLEGTNFTPNGIVVSPATWASLMLTTVPAFSTGATPVGTAYSIPGGVTISADGKMSIAGYPIIKANWINNPMAMVADWDFASIAQVENLKIEFFEQDSDNVERNLITARCEALEVMVIEQPLAFAYKNLQSAL